jgi:hypothetical protein
VTKPKKKDNKNRGKEVMDFCFMLYKDPEE